MLYQKENYEIYDLGGKIGEATIYSLMELPLWCWRRNKGLCLRRHDTEYLAQMGKVDADVMLTLNRCVRWDEENSKWDVCPLMEGWYKKSNKRKEKDIKQLHEIKTNMATFDKSIIGKSNRTQNIYIELIQTLGAYLNSKKPTEEDDRLTGGKLKYWPGVGWWDKREYAYNKGMTKINHATWYHFYEPLDLWERIASVEGFEDVIRPKGAEALYQKATDEEIKEWLKDDSIESEAILITQIPVEIIISIPGRCLEKIVDDIREKYNTNPDWPDFDHVRVEDNNLMGCKIPIKELIPCINMGDKQGKVIDPDSKGKTGDEVKYIGYAYEWAGMDANEYYEKMTYTNGNENVLVSLVGEYVRKDASFRKEKGIKRDGTPMRIKNLIPGMIRHNRIPLTSDAIYYVPARLAGRVGEDGIMRVNVKPYIDPYIKRKDEGKAKDEREEMKKQIWVPRIIRDFDLKLKVYDGKKQV